MTNPKIQNAMSLLKDDDAVLPGPEPIVDQGLKSRLNLLKESQPTLPPLEWDDNDDPLVSKPKETINTESTPSSSFCAAYKVPSVYKKETLISSSARILNGAVTEENLMSHLDHLNKIFPKNTVWNQMTNIYPKIPDSIRGLGFVT